MTCYIHLRFNIELSPASGYLLAALCCLAVSPSRVAADDKPVPPTGRWRGDIVDPVKKDVIMKVALHAPRVDGDELKGRRRLVLLVLHHGFQGNENNYIGLTVEALKRLKLDEQFVVISGKSKGPGWTTEDDARVLRVIDWAKQNYPIDPRRIFLFGSSNGAAFVGRFGSEHQDLLAGVVGYCGNYRFTADKMKADNAGETRTEWYFVHGGKDNPQNSRRACDFLKERGYRYIFRQMDGYGHTDIWDSRGHPDSKAADAVRDDWLKWIHALRHKEIAPTEAEQKALVALQPGPNLPTDALLVGGTPAGKALLPWLRSDDMRVRLNASGVLRSTLCGKEALAELIKTLNDPAAEKEKIIPGVLIALTTAATYRYPEAQAALADYARDPKKPMPFRQLATRYLGEAVQLMLLGNFEDSRAIWSLVQLLDDESLQGEAFKVLGTVTPDSFGYKPDQGKEERKAAIEKCRAWCREKCGAEPGK